MVVVYCAIEMNRLDYIRKNQNDLRLDYLSGLYDVVSRGEREGITVGSKIMLRNTFTGGPRYMYNHYLDALAICRSLGNPQFFITFTCNVKWPEIKCYMAQCPELTPNDRADIVCRVFEQKVIEFIKFLKEVKTFGYVCAVLSTTEFQKRGLLHCYTLLWVDSKSELQDAQHIDEFISAEIPDPAEDPCGYKWVTELMMHGPCGSANSSASCTQGPDRILAKISNSEASTSIPGNNKPIDEIQNYVDGRFICPFKAWWRIFDFPIHSRELAVQILSVHLENMQRVNFRERDRLDIIVNLPEKKKTTLTEWFVYNNENTDGRHLSLIHPNKRAECEALGLLGDDKEWDIALQESTALATSNEVRILFAQILIYCDVSDPIKLWIKHWEAMSDDIPANISKATRIPNYHVNTAKLKGYILYELEAVLNGFGKSVTDFGLPLPPKHLLKDLENKLLMEEKNYKCDLLKQEAAESVPKLNHDQKKIYDLIMGASLANQQELLFVYGHGGTEKTFLWKTVISLLRAEGKIVLAVASSGIASLLLPAGRTAHSRFKLPLELTDESLCHAKKSQLGNLLVEANLIIWDEAPMNDMRCFEKLDRILRDLMDAPNLLFGGKKILLGGDFRQTLFVKKGATKEELIAASIAESHLWWYFKICTLKKNMRLLRYDLTTEKRQRSEAFAKCLLDVGNGEIGEPDEVDARDSSWITILPGYLVTANETGLSQLIDFIYDDTTLRTPTAETLQEKAIVCPKNETPDIVNAKILSDIEGPSKTYLINDQAIPMGKETSETELLYPMKYLNTITFPRFPPHELELKVGSPIMLLRNVNLSGGLCNGTRMIVKTLMSKLIEAQIITGRRVGKKVFIHRIPLTYKDPNLSFTFKRTQFPVKLCYAMTINKSQGQSLSKIGIYLSKPVFSHGKESEFPEHHFECIPYNQLASRIPYRDENSKMIYPILTVNTVGKKHIFQIRFAPSTKKGAGKFVVEDILDIQTAVETHSTGTNTVLATISATTMKESTSKDKSTPGIVLTANPTKTINEPTNKDKQIPVSSNLEYLYSESAS
ncbi:DNA helicase [Tanacetum coccineum]